MEDTPRDEQTTTNEKIRAVRDVKKQNFDSYMLMKIVLKENQDSRLHKYTSGTTIVLQRKYNKNAKNKIRQWQKGNDVSVKVLSYKL